MNTCVWVLSDAVLRVVRKCEGENREIWKKERRKFVSRR